MKTQEEIDSAQRVAVLLRRAALMAQQLNELDGERYPQSWVDEIQGEAAALEGFLALALEPPAAEDLKAPSDPRIVRQVGKLRLVAPAARLESRWTRYLNGRLVIEMRSEDSLGAERWNVAQELRWKDPSEQTVFRLLAGDGWADADLLKYDRSKL